MHAVKYETIIKPDHRLSIELPASFPEGLAEVIVLAKQVPQEQQEPAYRDESLLELLDWLETLPPTGRTTEEILAQVAEERNSWDD